MKKLADLKLLMAEDNAINRKLADLLFKRHGITLDFAENGEEAVDKAVSNSFDLILMDIEMPLLGGVQAAQKIKDQLGTEAPKIVALTAHALEGQKEEFLRKGLDEYLEKPIKINDLDQIVSKLF